MATEKELLAIDEMAREHVARGLADGTIPPLTEADWELAIACGAPVPRHRAKAAS